MYFYLLFLDSINSVSTENAKQTVLTDNESTNEGNIIAKYDKGEIKYVGSEITRNTDEIINYEQLCQGTVPVGIHLIFNANMNRYVTLWDGNHIFFYQIFT